MITSTLLILFIINMYVSKVLFKLQTVNYGNFDKIIAEIDYDPCTGHRNSVYTENCDLISALLFAE